MVTNHAVGVLWPRGWPYETPVIDGLLGGGAVVVFFVVGAFIVADGLLRDLARDTFDPARFYLRRVVRLGAQLVLVCAAVWIAADLDDRRTVSNLDLAHNAMAVLTYTLNIFVHENIFTARPELGHLWYLSVQQQCYLVLPLVLFLLWRIRVIGFVLLGGLMVAVYLNRQDVLDDSGWVAASSLTTTRADGLIWGVMIALALPWLARLRGWDHVLWASCLALLGLKLLLPRLADYAYLGPWSVAFTLVSGVVVVAIWQLDGPTRFSRALSVAPLRRLGKASLAIFIWHLPIFVVVAQHTTDWRWEARTGLALAILTVVVVVAERWIDEPVRRLLASREVFRIRRPSVPVEPQNSVEVRS